MTEEVSKSVARNRSARCACNDPGKPWQNGTDESFNGKFRNECLTIEWFRNRIEPRVAIEQWRNHYNEERPHMSLGDPTPAEFKVKIKGGWEGNGSEPNEPHCQSTKGCFDDDHRDEAAGDVLRTAVPCR